MTIVACVKVRDGVVLGTDSMTHVLTVGGQRLRFYENAWKLFQVGSLSIGVLVYGLGNIGRRSIASLIGEFAGSLDGPVSVEVAARELFAFMRLRYDALARGFPPGQRLPGLGFYIAGYSHGALLAEEYEFLLPRDDGPVAVQRQEELGAHWRGVETPFSRLNGEPGPVVFDGMPLQDAVDYAVFILETTIQYMRFATDVPPCGGPLQVATITPASGFGWLAPLRLEVSR